MISLAFYVLDFAKGYCWRGRDFIRRAICPKADSSVKRQWPYGSEGQNFGKVTALWTLKERLASWKRQKQLTRAFESISEPDLSGKNVKTLWP
jgi:hypothetical protein